MTRSRHRSVAQLVATVMVSGLLVAALGPTPSAQATINPGSIAGTVTDENGDPLPGMTASVWDPTHYQWVGQDVTDATGAYQVDDLAAFAPGYDVRFADPSAEYAWEFYDDTLSPLSATAVPVTAYATTTGVDASLEPGASINGQLTTITGTPVNNGQVTIWWNTWPAVGTFLTDQTGRYTINGIRPGTYHLDFFDPASGSREWWENQPTGNTSTALVLAGGDSLTGIDAVLDGPVQDVVAPTVSGIAQVGQTLTASPGTWTPSGTTVTFRWVVGADSVPGDDPTGPTYVPTAADLGKSIRVQATGSYPGWGPASAWSGPTAAVAAAPVTAPAPSTAITDVVRPRVKGMLRVGQVVRVSRGVWKPSEVTFRYQWYLGGKAIADATHRRLTLRTPYVGKRLTVGVKARAAGHARVIVWTKPTGRVQP